MEIETIKGLAEKLYTIRQTITKQEEETKQMLVPLKAERDAVQSELITVMNEADLAGIRVASGDSFQRSTRKSVEIVLAPHALEWAKEHNAVSIDKRLVEQQLRDVDAEAVPKCFNIVEKEFISVRKNSKDEKST